MNVVDVVYNVWGEYGRRRCVECDCGLRNYDAMFGLMNAVATLGASFAQV